MRIRIRVLTICHGLEQQPVLLAGMVFLVALAIYVPTLAPGLLWGGGDFATFQTKAFTRQIESNVFGHPMWVVLAQPFVALPIGDVAYRANLASAVFASAALAFVFLAAQRITNSTGASLLATAVLMVSHTFWTYAVMPKPYSLNALMLAACIYLVVRWGHEKRGRDLYLFATLYGLSLLNHLVMFTAAAGFLVFIVLVARRATEARRQAFIAGVIYLAALLPYLLLVTGTGEGESTGATIGAFLHGFAAALTSPVALAVGLAAGAVLLAYQFIFSLPVGLLGVHRSWQNERSIAALLLIIALGNVAFLLGATDPRTGGDYIWNLHYYLMTYTVFGLWIAVGFAHLWPRLTGTRLRQAASLALFIAAPVTVYSVAPSIARPLVTSLSGFREVGGRDNLTYALSPWKHNETGARPFAESIVAALPPHSTLFADYSIWAVVNYLQVVEGVRPDLNLHNLPGAGSAQQLPFILEQAVRGSLYLADVNRYYDLADIQTRFDVTPAGPIYRLIPKQAPD
jgi:hypothetical protein